MELFAIGQGVSVRTLPLHITSHGRFSNCPVAAILAGDAGRTVLTWPSANLAIYAPVSIPASFTIARFMIVNGNTTGNVDLGIYSAAGKLLLNTTSTARSGTNGVQYITPTASVFPAGFYYLGCVIGSGAGTVDAVLTNGALPDVAQMSGFLQEALGSVALPSTMTPVRYAQIVVPSFGFTQSATL